MSRRSRGYSLLEMLAVMSAMSTVLVLLSVWLVMLLRGSDAGQQHLSWIMTAQRLATQFRRDVNQAHARIDTGSGLLRLRSSSDGTIAYRHDGKQLLREEFAGDELMRREAFIVPSPLRVTIGESESRDDDLVVLTISQSDDRGGNQLEEYLRVEAQLGALRRFENALPMEESP